MDDWFIRCVKLPDVILRESFDLDIQFEATRGSGPHGHIYVDDLEVVEKCVETGLYVSSVQLKKGTGYQHFLLFLQGFQKASFSKLLSLDCVVKG